MLLERFDCHGNGKIGFSSSGRADAKDNGIFLNGSDVAFLSNSSGTHHFSGCGEANAAVCKCLQFLSFALTDHHCRIADGLQGDGLTSFQHLQQGLQYRCCLCRFGFCSIDFDFCIPTNNGHFIELFQRTDIFVKISAKCLPLCRVLHVKYLFCHKIQAVSFRFSFLYYTIFFPHWKLFFLYFTKIFPV